MKADVLRSWFEKWAPLCILVAMVAAFTVWMIVAMAHSVQDKRSLAQSLQSMQESAQKMGDDHRRFEERMFPSFDKSFARLEDLAKNGCEPNIEDCDTTEAFGAERRVLEAMDREHRAFERSLTKDRIDALVDDANRKIAERELAYLRQQGGARTPHDLEMLSNVCHRFLHAPARPLVLNDEQTLKDLQRLFPPGTSEKFWCRIW